MTCWIRGCCRHLPQDNFLKLFGNRSGLWLEIVLHSSVPGHVIAVQLLLLRIIFWPSEHREGKDRCKYLWSVVSSACNFLYTFPSLKSYLSFQLQLNFRFNQFSSSGSLPIMLFLTIHFYLFPLPPTVSGTMQRVQIPNFGWRWLKEGYRLTLLKGCLENIKGKRGHLPNFRQKVPEEHDRSSNAESKWREDWEMRSRWGWEQKQVLYESSQWPLVDLFILFSVESKGSPE